MNRFRIIMSVLVLACFSAVAATAQKTEPTPPASVQKAKPAPTPRMVYKVEKKEQIFSVVEGKWDWGYLENSCRDRGFTISFSENRRAFYLTYEQTTNADGKPEPKVYTYDLLATSLFGVRGQLEGEKRLTADGKPVIWEIILLSKDEFCWRRTDMPISSCSKKIVRCQ